MIKREDVKWLQVEATTKCNAWCHSCGRNQGGFGLRPELVLEDLDTNRFEEVVSEFPNLEVIHFCGTYGDAMAAHNIVNLINIAKRHCKKIQINTNGSLRNTSWWQNFAGILSDIEHDIWFCIDGLQGVHEIYRQGTDFNTVIENATSFINAGGCASWQFIPWAHNEHQIKDCIRMSQELGFKKFEFIKHPRVPDNPKDYRTGQPVSIQPWSKNAKFSRFEVIKKHVPPEACQHLSQPSVYLNANGKLSICCVFNIFRSSKTFDHLGEVDRNNNNTCLKFCGVQHVQS